MSERPDMIAPDDAEAPFGRDADGKPIAPYGLTQEGRPRKSAAGRPANPDSKRSKRRAASSSSPPRRKPTPSSSARKQQGPDYAQGVMDLCAGPMVALTLAGMRAPALLADAAAMEMHLPPIAGALGELAQTRPEVAAMLDRLMVAGPYTALVSATLPLGLQLAANHGLVKPGVFGTVPPEQLIGEIAPPSEQQLAEWAAAAAAEHGGSAAGGVTDGAAAPPNPFAGAVNFTAGPGAQA